MKSYINKRLLSCASLVRPGSVLGDIGTDHGYLPIYLLSKNLISGAVLSDINEGPLSKAEANVKKAGLADSVTLRLCDGAAALGNLGITDYCIAGMGGELIASIISAAPQLFCGDIRLILQPMSKPEVLRSYLYDSGFTVEREVYSVDDGKYYVCLLAKYDGIRKEYSAVDAIFGSEANFIAAHSPEMMLYMAERERSLLRVIEGKHLGGSCTADEELLLSALRKRLEMIKGV